MAPNYKIKYIGIRPGEKMHELLFSIDETVEIFIMKPIPNLKFQKFHQSQ